MVGALTSVGVALAARGYADAAGDANSAPDITTLEISEAAPGTLTIRMGVGNFQALPARSWVNLWFDTDSNQQTGDAGDEALVRFSADGTIELFTWDGARLIERSSAGVSAVFAAGVLELSVPRSAIAAVQAFGLLAVTSRQQIEIEDLIVASDFVPDDGRAAFASTLVTVTDPAGDQDAAPDIAAVRVSDAKSGWVTFAISTLNYATLPPESLVALIIDVDDNRRTGEDGADVGVTVGGGEIALERWEARSGWLPDELPTRARVRQGPNVVFVDVHVSELENTRRLGFSLAALDINTAEQQIVGIDVAPDTGAFWRYTLVNKAAVKLVFTKVVTKPGRPRAGKPFTVGFAATRSDTGRGVASGTVGCRVLSRERRVPAKGRIAGGAGLCTLVVPKGAVGSVLRGTVTVKSGGATVAWDFAFVVL